MTRAVFQLMLDQLGVAQPDQMPDVTELLSAAGLYDRKQESLAMSAYDDNAGTISKITQDLVDRDKAVADEVAETARQGTALNKEIWDEVVALRAAVTAVGDGKLPQSVEAKLLDTFGESLLRVWEKYEVVTGYNKKAEEAIGPITLDELKALVPKTDPGKLAAYLPHLNEAMRSADIVGSKREAAFIAQVLHETDGLRTLTEYGSKGYFERNYGRSTAVGRALGNEQPGDGARFHGRGALQITGATTMSRRARRSISTWSANPISPPHPSTRSASPPGSGSRSDSTTMPTLFGAQRISMRSPRRSMVVAMGWSSAGSTTPRPAKHWTRDKALGIRCVVRARIRPGREHIARRLNVRGALSDSAAAAGRPGAGRGSGPAGGIAAVAGTAHPAAGTGCSGPAGTGPAAGSGPAAAGRSSCAS